MAERAWRDVLRRVVTEALGSALRARRARDTSAERPAERPSKRPGGRRPSAPGRPAPRSPEPAASGSYPGDFRGRPPIEYAPVPGPRPDPGEVVWGWVPYEEDHGRGKDRPVLLIGRDGPWLLGLPLTTADHDRDAAQEAAAGRFWVDIGTGAWDSRGRASEARVDRVVRLDPDAVRRTSAPLERALFDEVAREVRRHLG